MYIIAEADERLMNLHFGFVYCVCVLCDDIREFRSKKSSTICFLNFTKKIRSEHTKKFTEIFDWMESK